MCRVSPADAHIYILYTAGDILCADICIHHNISENWCTPHLFLSQFRILYQAFYYFDLRCAIINILFLIGYNLVFLKIIIWLMIYLRLILFYKWWIYFTVQYTLHNLPIRLWIYVYIFYKTIYTLLYYTIDTMN